MASAATDAPTQPAEEAEKSVPSLSIAHLMLFTACSAGYLSILRDDIHRLDRPPGALFLTLNIAYAICIGPALAAIFLFPHWKKQSITVPKEPGEHLLLLLGRNEVFLIAMGYVVNPDTTTGAIFLLPIWVVLVLGSMWPAWHAADWSIAWRFSFPLWVIAFVMTAFEDVLLAIIGFGTLVTFVGIALSYDLKTRQTIRWTHGYGGIIVVLQAFIQIIGILPGPLLSS